MKIAPLTFSIFIILVAFLLPLKSIGQADMSSNVSYQDLSKYESERHALMKLLQQEHSRLTALEEARLLYKMAKLDVEYGHGSKLEEVLNQLTSLALTSNELEIKVKIAELESAFFQLKGLYRQANQSYKNFIKLQDSFEAGVTNETISAILEKNKIREQELVAEKYSSLKIFIYALIISLLVSIGFLIYGVYKRNKVVALNIHLAAMITEYVGSYSSKLSDPSYGEKVIQEVKSDHEVSVNGLTDDIVLKILNGLKRFEEEGQYLLEDCTINDVADLLNTNKTYLSKVINVVKKKPFTNYINELRLVHAIQLLKEDTYKKYTIKAISKEAGFKSKSTFNLAFKEYTGLTPSEFIHSMNTK